MGGCVDVCACESVSIEPNVLRICRSKVKGTVSYNPTSKFPSFIRKKRNRISLLSLSGLFLPTLGCTYIVQIWAILVRRKVSIYFLVHFKQTLESTWCKDLGLHQEMKEGDLETQSL